MQKDQEISWLIEKAIRAGLVLGDWAACLHSISLLKTLNFSDYDIRCLEARAMCALHLFDEAESVINHLRSVSYTSSSLYHCLGLIALERGQLTESNNFFLKAMDLNEGSMLDPSISQNLTYRAKCLALQGNRQEALEELSIVKNLELLEKAFQLYKAGDYDMAQACLKAMPDSMLASNYTRILLCRCLIAQGDFAESIRITTEIIGSSESCKSAYYYRAIASLNAKQFSQCKHDLSRLIEAKQRLLMVECLTVDGRLNIFDSLDGRMLRAQANCLSDNFVEAMKDLDYVLIRRPSWQAHMARSHTAFGLTLYGTALGDAQAALALEPGNVEAEEQYSRCWMHLNKSKQNATTVPLQYSLGFIPNLGLV